MGRDPGRNPMTLDELEILVMGATDPREIFGDDVEGNLRRFRSVCEAYEDTKEGRRAQAVLDALERFARFTPDDVRALARAEAVFRSLTDDDRPALKAAPSYTSPRRGYLVSGRL